MLKKNILFLLAAANFVFALSDKRIDEIKAGVEQRKEQILTSQVKEPEPSYKGHSQEPMRYAFNRLNFALALLELDRSPKLAGKEILNALEKITKEENEEFYFYGEAGLHWQGAVLGRTLLLFGENGYTRKSIDGETYAVILDYLWRWAYENNRPEDTEYENSQSWAIWESENHDIMHDSLCWMISKLLKESPQYCSKKYKHGVTPAEEYDRWNKYFEKYLSQRGRKGLFAEIGSTGYTKHTLQCLYNLYDFSPIGSRVKELSKNVLDLWWADWAIEQFDGYRGGSKIRCYRKGTTYDLGPCRNGDYQCGRLFSWIYTGIGKEASRNSCVMTAATSDYMIADAVIDLIVDVDSRGKYEIISRRPAANLQPRPEWAGEYSDSRLYALNPVCNGKVKYSYCTPDFIMGCDMNPKLPDEDWYAWGQNLWAGILFRGGGDKIIYAEALMPAGERGTTYSQHWAVQRKNTMILQRNENGWQVGDMRVWFADGLDRSEEDGWVFVDGGRAYAAVKVSFGGYQWDDKNWLRLKDKDAPIIFEAVSAKEYPNFQAFKADVLDNKFLIQKRPSSEKLPFKDEFSLRDDILYYEGIQDSGSFSFFFRSSRTPEVDHIPIDYNPDFTFKSPFLNQAPYGSESAVVSKDGCVLEINF